MRQNHNTVSENKLNNQTIILEEKVVEWLFGCRIHKKTRTKLRIILNCIVLPLAMFLDVIFYATDSRHICVFVALYLIVNLPTIKKHSDNDWMMGV